MDLCWQTHGLQPMEKIMPILLPWAPRRDQGMNAWSFLNGLKVCLLEFKTQVNNLLLGRTRTDQKITHGRRCLPKIQAKEQASHLPGNTCCCSKGPKVCFLARWEVGRVKKKKRLNCGYMDLFNHAPVSISRDSDAKNTVSNTNHEWTC